MGLTQRIGSLGRQLASRQRFGGNKGLRHGIGHSSKLGDALRAPPPSRKAERFPYNLPGFGLETSGLKRCSCPPSGLLECPSEGLDLVVIRVEILRERFDGNKGER
jgi:hypothetical protein